MRLFFLIVVFLLPCSSLHSSPVKTEKPIPHFRLTFTSGEDNHLDWDFDNIIFGSSRDEVHPDLCATANGYLYACCSALDGEGCFDYMRLRWSTNGGLSWEPALDLHAEHPLGLGRLAADDDYIYLVYEYFPMANDVDIYLARLPIGSSDLQELFILPIATAPSIEKSPAIHSDGRNGSANPHVYITHAKIIEQDSLCYLFHLSIDQGLSLYRSSVVASFREQTRTARSSLATSVLSGETHIYFACEAERSGQRGSMVYTMISHSFGATWSTPQPLVNDHRTFSLPSVFAHGSFALVTCTFEPVPNDLDVIYCYTQDLGQNWSEPIQVSPGESYDTEPQAVIEPDGNRFHIGFIHFISEDSDTGTVWVRRGTTSNPDSIELPVAVANENLVASGFQLGMCAGSNLPSYQGAALAWTCYFILGDTDVKFDASWRGDNSYKLQKSISTEFSLCQNWPNPFNSSTSIEFELQSGVQTRLIIHDIVGREIMQLDFGLLSRGYHIVTFDMLKSPSGTYFYTLQAGQMQETLKMILVK